MLLHINSNKRLGQYKMTKYDSYTELICHDNCGGIWIFKITGIMNYTVLLDSYTVSVKSSNT